MIVCKKLRILVKFLQIRGNTVKNPAEFPISETSYLNTNYFICGSISGCNIDLRNYFGDIRIFDLIKI